MRYYFHIRDLDGLIPDEEGSELSNIADARMEARASALDFAMNDLRCGHRIDERRIEIANEDGRILETVSVRDVILPRTH